MASLVQRPDRPTWYIQYYLSGKLRRVSTATESFQIAKEKLRQFESAQARGEVLPLPTKTPIADVVGAYVARIRTKKTAKSAQTDIYYLRDVFGPICQELEVTSRKISDKAKKRPPKRGQDRRKRAPRIEANCFEKVTTSDIDAFITGQVGARGLAPKTANRYREILLALFNWAMKSHGIRMPLDKNPAAEVARYKVGAPKKRHLSLPQIDEQLDALAGDVKMQAMVATLIFAGLRREELLWLRPQDFDWDFQPYGQIQIQAKTVAGESWEPKTKVNRGIPIGSRLRPYLDKWRMKGGRGTWFFPNSAGGRWDPDNFSRALRAANAATKLVWTNLDYRHTFGSQLAKRGESLYKIATLMGNSPQIAERHYASLSIHSLVGCVECPMIRNKKGPYYSLSESEGGGRVRSDVVRVSPTNLTTRNDSVPAVIAEGGANAQFAYEEFFSGLESPHTIAAYRRDLNCFLEHVHQVGLSLQQMTPRLVRAYLDNLKPVKSTDPPLSAPTKKRVLAAIRKFFDFAVTRHAAPINPALSVKAPKHKVTEGKTPEITVPQARQLLAAIDTSSVVALRDRAVLATLSQPTPPVLSPNFIRGTSVTLKSTDTTQPNQFLFDWSNRTEARPTSPEILSQADSLSLSAAVFPQASQSPQSGPLPEPFASRNPDLLQVLPWDFRTSFPQPLEEAILNGTFQPEDAEPDNLASLHEEHARHGLRAKIRKGTRSMEPVET